MRLLVLAPHPFFEVRGTPIDVDIFLRAVTSRPNISVDLLVYGEGDDRCYPNLTLHRVPVFGPIRGVRPGFSLKKLATDALMFFKAWSLVRGGDYDVIHAGEEAVFMAMVMKTVYGIPFVYDLDSSVAQQLVEKSPVFGVLSSAFSYLETRAIRSALATAPVCNALAELCRNKGSRKVVTLHDISQLENPDQPASGLLRQQVASDGPIFLYVGNLEEYQGVDLLLEGFALAVERAQDATLVIVGGSRADVEKYVWRASELGIAERTSFLGAQPLEDLAEYLADADVLVAPRIRGINTPMKVFPYLHSGKPVLVTDLPTHSQILTPDVAMLAKPTPAAFGEAIVRLAGDSELRTALGRAGREFAETNHTFEAHERRVRELYDWVEAETAAANSSRAKR